MSCIIPIKSALISVYDKDGLCELATFLQTKNVLLFSTGKTKEYLLKNKIKVNDVTQITKTNMMLGGRVKTLNPFLHAGILFDRNNKTHETEINKLDIPSIDLVVSNLYPFSHIAQNPNATDQDIIENIDIGGPTMIRAAAKNHEHVHVLSSIHQYKYFIDHYQQNNGTTKEFRRKAALDAFSLTSEYDYTIASSFKKRFSLSKENAVPLRIDYEKKVELRYGENPHQKARLYCFRGIKNEVNLASTAPLQGKQLSYNNLLDAHAASMTLRSIVKVQKKDLCSVIIVKHGTPCGAGIDQEPVKAFKKAFDSDKKSAFGGIIALNQPVDFQLAQNLNEHFFEIIIAPDFTDDALKILKRKKNLRLLGIKNLISSSESKNSIRSILGGILLQDLDFSNINTNEWETVTKISPTKNNLASMKISFAIAKNAISNAIAITSDTQLLGLGTGQPNRINSVKIAINHARTHFCLKHASLASDGFFPFADSIEYAAQYGIKSIIQPGGSKKDKDVIKRADELGICMIFTHKRHFRH